MSFMCSFSYIYVIKSLNMCTNCYIEHLCSTSVWMDCYICILPMYGWNVSAVCIVLAKIENDSQVLRTTKSLKMFSRINGLAVVYEFNSCHVRIIYIIYRTPYPFTLLFFDIYRDHVYRYRHKASGKNSKMPESFDINIFT